LTALLEMTNRLRTGGVFSFGALGLLVRVCGDCFAAVALRFNISIQTNDLARRFRNSLQNHREFAASDEIGAFIAVKLELRTPED
jgi:hypothetical protein